MNNVYDSTMETDGSRDLWVKNNNFIVSILETLYGGLSKAEIVAANTIYKHWKDFGKVHPESTYNFKNKNFVFTGFRDACLVIELNNNYGSVVHNTITGSTKVDYLICADTSRDTVKMKRARQQGAVVMTKEELLKLI
jgi:hypothetical protein